MNNCTPFKNSNTIGGGEMVLLEIMVEYYSHEILNLNKDS